MSVNIPQFIINDQKAKADLTEIDRRIKNLDKIILSLKIKITKTLLAFFRLAAVMVIIFMIFGGHA